MHFSAEKILKGQSADGVFEEGRRDLGQSLRYSQPHLARGSERVALNVVDVERPSLSLALSLALVCTRDLLICLVATPIDSIEEQVKIVQRRHVCRTVYWNSMAPASSAFVRYCSTIASDASP